MKMTSDARGFVATSPDGESYEFLSQFLYHQLVVNYCATAVDHFTVEQKRRAADNLMGIWLISSRKTS
jgi:hypothetical protein